MLEKMGFVKINKFRIVAYCAGEKGGLFAIKFGHVGGWNVGMRMQEVFTYVASRVIWRGRPERPRTSGTGTGL